VGIILGIIGGIAPPSTFGYYRALMAGYRERRPGGYPSIVINSIDLTRLLDLVGAGRMAELVDFLAGELGGRARPPQPGPAGDALHDARPLLSRGLRAAGHGRARAG
jgi:hypothetical protein